MQTDGQRQTNKPQSQQQAQDNQNSEKPPQVVDQPSRNQLQPQQPLFETQKQVPNRYIPSAEGPKQRDFDEAARQRTQYRERLQRIVSHIDSIENKPKMSNYIPAQYQREDPKRGQDKECRQQKLQNLAERSSEGQSLPPERAQQQLPRDQLQPPQPQILSQNQPQSRQKQHKQPVEKRFGQAVRGLSQQRFRTQQLMDVPQGRSKSGQPLQQLSHAHPEPQRPQYIRKASVKSQALFQPPQPPQVQSLKETIYRKDAILPKSVRERSSLIDSQTLEALFRPEPVESLDSFGAQANSLQQPQVQHQEQQAKQQLSSQDDSYPWKFVRYGPGQPPSEPGTDYEQLSFDGSRSPSIVSLSSDGDEDIVVIGKWKATEGDGSFW
ncbi:uncharacterized protein ACHE_80082A [Aspergillus chevalieri]|uniref:Uncharacterized protein n=1 Tax=Aspergillus chevalieri TaxID=182096 RepID=A0A7R7VWQ4_ASPCH|nr:uncharacterized protein ACHE_80082A [Aspergillus chevalieri]BCR92182.1 hypothetical protein ACHE_80082A [Aspergillus chevalieri]